MASKHFLQSKIFEIMLRASCLTLEINEFRRYEAKIEESEKAGSRRESNPGHLPGVRLRHSVPLVQYI